MMTAAKLRFHRNYEVLFSILGSRRSVEVNLFVRGPNIDPLGRRGRRARTVTGGLRRQTSTPSGPTYRKHRARPYDFTGSGALDAPRPYKFIRLGTCVAPAPIHSWGLARR